MEQIIHKKDIATLLLDRQCLTLVELQDVSKYTKVVLYCKQEKIFVHILRNIANLLLVAMFSHHLMINRISSMKILSIRTGEARELQREYRSRIGASGQSQGHLYKSRWTH